MAVVSLCAEHPTQFRVDSESPLELPGLVTSSGIVINQDRLGDVCDAYQGAGQSVSLTNQAVDRYRDVMDESPVVTPSLTLPEGFELYRFQRRCVNNLSKQPKAFVQTSTGTGKSVLGTALGCLRFDAGEIDRLIVWCPSTLIGDWVSNIERFTSLSVGTVSKNANPDRRAKWYVDSEAQVWVLNYERVRTADLKSIDAEVRRRKGRIMFLMDEVSKLKSRTSKLHKAMRNLVGRNRVPYVVGMTATPIVTGPEDFYNEFRIIDPDVFGLVRDFERDFTINCGERDFWGNYIGYKDVDLMHVRAGERVFSASKRQPEIAKEFPETHEIPIELDLSKPERELYDEIFQYGKGIREGRVGTLFYFAFRRLCNMPQMLLTEPFVGEDYSPYGIQAERIWDICLKHVKAISESKNSAKLARTIELVDEVLSSGEKLIIFADHTHNCLFPLAEHLRDKGFDPLMYVGDMSDSERETSKQLFKTGRNLLLMSDAGQMGLNFQECRTVLHYQTPVTHAAYDQRSNRVNRIDSTYDSVDVYRFITRGTVEERVEDTMQGRRALSVQAGFGGEYEEYGTLGEADADFLCGFW